MSDKKPTTKKQTAKAVKIGHQYHDLLVAEALRLGVREGRMVSLQEVVEKVIEESLSGKPKPELKE